MKSVRILLLSNVMIAMSLACAPQDEPQPATLDDIRPEAIRAHIRLLADDLYEGRGTGSRGYELAAKYVAAQFESFGLEPAGQDGTFFQRVPLRRTHVVPTQSSVTLFTGNQQRTLVVDEHYVPSGDPNRPQTTVEAPVVFVGYGMTAPEIGYDDYDGIDVEGKIVAMLTGAPAVLGAAERAHYSGRPKRDNAVGRGAVGMLFIRTPQEEQLFPWEVVVRFSNRGGMSWLDEQGSASGSRPEIRGGALLSRGGTEILFRDAPKS